MTLKPTLFSGRAAPQSLAVQATAPCGWRTYHTRFLGERQRWRGASSAKPLHMATLTVTRHTKG